MAGRSEVRGDPDAVRDCTPRGATMLTPVDLFERHRRHLFGLAYRLLGTAADAEDMVQETFLRWDRASRPTPTHPRAWFVRTCTRLCLDRLKSAQRTRETYPGDWLPEPVLDATLVEQPPDAETQRGVDESVSMALLHTIERLRPQERAVFLLHDVFDYRFGEVAEVLSLTPAHCRQLAVRARRTLRIEGSDDATDLVAASQLDAATAPSAAEVERLAEAFVAAVRGGDMAALQGVLADDVVLRADGGGKVTALVKPLHGARSVAGFFIKLAASWRAPQAVGIRMVQFNGAPGLVLLGPDGPVTAFQFQVRAGRICGVYAMRNPDKLGAFRASEPN